MSTDLRHIISNLLAESSHFNVNDVLVNARADHPKLIFTSDFNSFDLDAFPKQILRETQLNLKESGVNTLCIARGILRHEINGKHVDSPLQLTPLTSSVDRVRKELKLEELKDEAFLNPFVLKTVRNQLEIVLPDESLVAEGFDRFIDILRDKGLTVSSDIVVIGNFHHHRYDVLKELEELLELTDLSPALGELFGEEAHFSDLLELHPTNLFPADVDQEMVFDSVKKSHTVIQGPPGTGKSQVISNLIGKALGQNQSILVVSEKYSALEVIQAKLKQFDLDLLCFIAGSDRQSHQFLGELKKSWDFFESYIPSTEINLRLSEQYEDHLQMTLDLLNQPELIGGISFHEFKDLTRGEPLGTNYSSKVPSIAVLIEHKYSLKWLFELKLHKSLAHIRKRTIAQDDFHTFDQKIGYWQEKIALLNSVFTLESWNDVSRAMSEAAVCQVFENELFKKYKAVFKPNSKEQKQFLRLAKQYEILTEMKEIGSEWKIHPSLTEAKSLQTQLQTGTFFGKRAAKKRWKQLSNLPLSEAYELLQIRLLEGEREQKLSTCISQLQKIGISDPANEIDPIRHSLPLFSEERWQSYLAIPLEHRANITLHHKTLNDFHHDVNAALKMEGSERLNPFFDQLKNDLPHLLAERKNILLLEQIDFASFQNCADFSDYKKLVLTSNYTIFKERFPAFGNFDPSKIKPKVGAILDAQQLEAQLHAKHLLDSIYARFSSYHSILNTPANRLTSDEKAFKKELKKGKAILVKEFGKMRSHPTLRELFQSEARHWISILKPIWLSNPSSLAKCFPMDQCQFDLVIFDEASQIPIQHSLGAIQRSKRVVVAGDEHQMGPSSYFQAGSNEVQDLLHQANYYFPKVPLLHHYRSVHPELIAFSNKHFYGGKLTAYPSAGNTEDPIRHHYIEQGRFIDRKNLPEAKAISNELQSFLIERKSIGVVAFSEEQLACIWKELDASAQDKLLEHQELYGGFFKALENVQGDECDHLLIGFGYAPDEQGIFNLRFGPINTANGRKRLNVLLTRARETIDFFCSVRSTDFKLSENESINLLRQWIAFSETSNSPGEIQFPHGLMPKMEKNGVLEFNRIQEVLPAAREIVTLQGVLENRGWTIMFS